MQLRLRYLVCEAAPTRAKEKTEEFSRLLFIRLLFIRLLFIRLQADRGCAAVAFRGSLVGVKKKRCDAPRGLRSSEKKEILRKPTVL